MMNLKISFTRSNVLLAGSDDNQMLTICYYEDWNVFRRGKGHFEPEDILYEPCTHIIYVFAVLDDETKDRIMPGEPTIDIEENLYSRVVQLKKNGPKVMLGLGGWMDSTEKYGEMLRTEELRAHAVHQISEFIVKYEFDGLELDILYPGAYQGNESTGTPQDKDYFLAFLRELRGHFDFMSNELKRDRLLLSIAGPTSERRIQHGYLVPGIVSLCDWIDVITYDIHGYWEERTGLVAPFTSQPGDDENDETSNVQAAMETWMNHGAPANKLVLGIPSFGRTFVLVDPKQTDINSPACGDPDEGEYTRYPGYLSYYEIMDRVNNKGWTVVHKQNIGSYAYNGNQWVGFDDKYDVAVKADYVKKKGFRGAALWSLGLDCFQKDCPAGQHPLLKTIRGILTDELKLEDVTNYL
uniref:Chitinase 5 n=1 Tax=Phenacoccus solenopsis TaxID=483260 RepID=A0A4Y5SUD6_9HEMI|nr:chitinase 5 [Phenacoccus solenopsis]